MILNNTYNELKFSELKQFDIYKMDKTSGECTEKLEVSNGLFQSYFKGWLQGKYPDIFYDDLLEFIKISKELNIDFENLSAVDYGQAFVNKLVTSYITPNNEVGARNEATRADLDLYSKRNKFIGINIEDFLLGKEQIDFFDDDLNNIYDKIMHCGFYNNNTYDYEVLKILKRLNIIKPPYFFDDNGILIDADGDILELKVSILSNKDFKDLRCIFIKSGYLIAYISNNDTLLYLPPTLIREYADTLHLSAESRKYLQFVHNNAKYSWGDWITYYSV